MGLIKALSEQTRLVWLVLLSILISACHPAAAAPHATVPNQPTAPLATEAVPQFTATPPATATAQPSPTATPPSLWLPDYLPPQLVSQLELPEGAVLADQQSEANLRLEIVKPIDANTPVVIPWVYALAAPFPTVEDEASLADLQDAWKTGSSPGLPIKALIVDPSTADVFKQVWGKASDLVKVMPAGAILETAWSQKQAWAIVPFENLEPRRKVILVDGQSPVRKDFDQTAYGLTMYFGLTGDTALAQQFLPGLPAGNREPSRMTTVVLTGVTALVRGTASLMEGRGMTYPAQDIGAWLREADILHISNEVPFAKNCPQPFNWEGLAFCSQEEYIQLLEYVGADVIELTGDHFKDWGPEAMLFTLELYKQRGWKYYGGGANAEEASKPVLLEHNGNRIAFLGCNAKEEGYSSANDTTPGAIHCNFDQMERSVRGLVNDGYQPIVTFQHLEYYSYQAHPILQEDFHKMARAGAVIVQGSQAHQPHAFEFLPGSFLHYGLGNLFFDQTNQGEPPRTAFIDRHIFYKGKHISTELLTIYFVDYARSRPMTIDERQALLKNVFAASGWEANDIHH